ncbi:hypothetical protein E2320_002944 [Naja naja]|nr:hypothetical protein E2320_002944 [Naja naja]
MLRPLPSPPLDLCPLLGDGKMKKASGYGGCMLRLPPPPLPLNFCLLPEDSKIKKVSGHGGCMLWVLPPPLLLNFCLLLEHSEIKKASGHSCCMLRLLLPLLLNFCLLLGDSKMKKSSTLQYQSEKKKYIVKTLFADLYSKEDVPEGSIQHYLEEKGLPVTLEEDREEINREITLKELQEAILKQKNNKTLGLDGLPGKLYETLQENLEMQLLELYNEVYVDMNSSNIREEYE